MRQRDGQRGSSGVQSKAKLAVRARARRRKALGAQSVACKALGAQSVACKALGAQKVAGEPSASPAAVLATRARARQERRDGVYPVTAMRVAISDHPASLAVCTQ